MKVALDRFIAAKKEKEIIIDEDPSKWGKNQSKYENEILDIYGPIRGDNSVKISIGGKGYSADMTNAIDRYNNLKQELQ